MTRPIMMTRTACSVLTVLFSGSSYGLKICQLTGLSAGSVYTVLQRLERAGWVEGAWEEGTPSGRPKRRAYGITADGRTAVAEWRQSVSPARASWIPLPQILGSAT